MEPCMEYKNKHNLAGLRKRRRFRKCQHSAYGEITYTFKARVFYQIQNKKSNEVKRFHIDVKIEPIPLYSLFSGKVKVGEVRRRLETCLRPRARSELQLVKAPWSTKDTEDSVVEQLNERFQYCCEDDCCEDDYLHTFSRYDQQEMSSRAAIA